MRTGREPHPYAEVAASCLEAFRGALLHARATSADVLRNECVEPNIATAFGREHGFSKVTNADDFRRSVPIRSYDELAPYVERAAEGEPSVLTMERPFAFHRTSGTTGSAKKIPATLRDATLRVRVRAAADGELIANFPHLAERTDALFSLIGDVKPASTFTKGGIPYASATALREPLAGFATPWRQAPWAQIPSDVTEYSDRLYLRIRHAVEADVIVVRALNPSTLLVLGEQLRMQMPRLIEEVRNGTVSGKRERLPNPQRASQLEAILHGGAIEISAVWSNLRAVVCWKDGSTALYIPAVERIFGGSIPILSGGLVSSECWTTMAAGSVDSQLGGLCAITAHFFEFIPSSTVIQPAGETLLFHELEVGHEYHLVVTTASGLYRYSTGDMVRVVDRLRDVPRLQFIGRECAFSFTGEKLTESQLMAAFSAASRSMSIDHAQFVCCPVWEEPPYYAFLVEAREEIALEVVASLERALEAELRQRNIEYPDKRSSGRLRPVRIHALQPGTFRRYWERELGLSAAPSQYKQWVIDKRKGVLESLLDIRGTRNDY